MDFNIFEFGQAQGVNYDTKDVENFKKLVNSGIDPERAKRLIQQNKQQVQTGTSINIQSDKGPEKGFFSGLGESASQSLGIIGKAIATPFLEAPRIGANIASLPVDIVGGKYFGTPVPAAQELAQSIREKGAEISKKGEEAAGFTPSEQGIAQFTTNIASSLVGPSKVFKTVDAANKTIKGLATLANTSIEGAGAAISNYVASEGRLPTPKEVATFVATNIGLKGIGAGFEKLSAIPTSRIVPTTPTELGRDIQKGLDIGRTIRDTGISLNKKSLIGKIEKKIGVLSDDVDSAINKVIQDKGPNNVTINSIVKGIKDKIVTNPEYKRKLQGTPIDMQDVQAGIDETIESYQKLFKGKKLDLNAQQQLKKDIYSGLQATFKKADTAKLSARQVTEKEIAKTLKEGLEKQVPVLSKLNKELAPLLEAETRLKAKGGFSGYLTDILAGGFASGNPTTILSDPAGYAKNFATGVLVKRLGTSTAAKTTTATILKKMNQLFENPAFIRTIQEKTKDLYSNKP